MIPYPKVLYVVSKFIITLGDKFQGLLSVSKKNLNGYCYIGSRILCKRFAGSKTKIMKRTFAVFFLLYLALRLTLTLFDPLFGRENGVRAFNFIPLALFLPIFFKPCKNCRFFLLATACIVMAIELLQLVLAVGSCDIDDLILNFFGAGVAFLILQIKPIKKLVNKLTFL